MAAQVNMVHYEKNC